MIASKASKAWLLRGVPDILACIRPCWKNTFQGQTLTYIRNLVLNVETFKQNKTLSNYSTKLAFELRYLDNEETGAPCFCHLATTFLFLVFVKFEKISFLELKK
jgi:hypothetical protein